VIGRVAIVVALYLVLHSGVACAKEARLEPVDSTNTAPPRRQEGGRPHGDFFQTMTPDEQVKFMKLLDEWGKLTPEQRHDTLEKFGESRNLTPEQREKIQKGLQRFEQMPSEQRERIRDRLHKWQQMSPEERNKVRTHEQERRQKAEADLKQQLEKLDAHPTPEQMKWIRQFYFQKHSEVERQVFRRARELKEKLGGNATEAETQALRRELQEYRSSLEEKARPEFEAFVRNPHALPPPEFRGKKPFRPEDGRPNQPKPAASPSNEAL